LLSLSLSIFGQIEQHAVFACKKENMTLFRCQHCSGVFSEASDQGRAHQNASGLRNDFLPSPWFLSSRNTLDFSNAQRLPAFRNIPSKGGHASKFRQAVSSLVG
jgi:hypothetical protein